MHLPSNLLLYASMLSISFTPDPEKMNIPRANTWTARKIFSKYGNICIFPALQSNMFSFKLSSLPSHHLIKPRLHMQDFKILFIDNHARWEIWNISSESLLTNHKQCPEEARSVQVYGCFSWLSKNWFCVSLRQTSCQLDTYKTKWLTLTTQSSGCIWL